MEKKIAVLGVPMDFGQMRRGVDMGPSAIRYAGLIERLEKLNYHVKDLGNLNILHQDIDENKSLRNLHIITQINEKLMDIVSDTMAQDICPLIIGGDHSIAIGTLAGTAKQYDQMGVIWFDAHGDLNTDKTSPSGNIHGMPLAASLGFGHPELTEMGGYKPKIKPENIVIIGARDLDEGEKELIREQNIRVYTMHEIDRMGMPDVMKEAIQYLEGRVDGVHLSFDLDVIDPSEAPGVGTPVLGGISFRESHLAMEMLAESNLISSVEVVEVNPILDEKNKTAELAVALMGSLFGEKLL